MGHNKSNNHGIDNLIKAMTSEDFKHGFSFTNLVDFDALYGHRRDPHGYRDCLHEFDQRLPEIIAAMREDDLLMITADPRKMIQLMQVQTILVNIFLSWLIAHHSKEMDLFQVGHFSDISATVAENFGVDKAMIGEKLLG